MRSARAGGLQPVRDRGSSCGPSATTPIARCTRASVARSRFDGRLVEQQDRRVDEPGPGERDELALARRQRPAPLAHRVQVAAGQRGDEVVGADGPRRGLDLGVGGVGPAVGDVVADRARRTGTPPAARRRAGGGTRRGRASRTVDAVDAARARRSGRRSGRRASRPSTCRRRSRRRARPSRPARCAGRRRAAPRRRPCRVAEVHVVEARRRRASRPGSTGCVGLGRARRRVASSSSICAIDDARLLLRVEHLRELLDRREEQVEVEQERDDDAGGDDAVGDEHACRRRARAPRRCRRGQRRTGSRCATSRCGAEPVRRGTRRRPSRKPADVAVLAHERLRDPHARQALLQVGVDRRRCARGAVRRPRSTAARNHHVATSSGGRTTAAASASGGDRMTRNDEARRRR